MISSSTRTIADAVRIPVVASGGAGTPEHLYQALTEGRAEAALVASIAHFGTHGIAEIKEVPGRPRRAGAAGGGLTVGRGFPEGNPRRPITTMNISSLPFTITNWEDVPATEHPGATGTARMRTIEAGELRVRLVEYSANYLADHWCTRGHFVHVLEGELIMELQDGRAFTVVSGMSFQVADDSDPHRATYGSRGQSV